MHELYSPHRCSDKVRPLGGGQLLLDGKIYEQNEIEFLPVDARDAADQLMLAKWVIRNLAQRQGLDITFAPKITARQSRVGSAHTYEAHAC